MSLDPKQIAVWLEQASVAAELLPVQVGTDSLGGRYAVALAREAVPTLVAEIERLAAIVSRARYVVDMKARGDLTLDRAWYLVSDALGVEP